MENPTITVFRNVREVNTPYYTTLENIYERITQGKSKDLIEKIQALENKKERDKLKAELPSILFSGKFASRKIGATPLIHSGYIILDIDKCEQLQEKIQLVKSDQYTCMLFISPSGKGFKVLVKIPADNERHLGYFLGLEKYYLETYKIKLDASGKNIGRVCYESYDPNAYLNLESKLFDTYIEPIHSKEKNKSSINVFSIKSDDKIIEKILVWWRKSFDFNSGRNIAIYQLACAMNRFGIYENLALSECLRFEDNSRANDPFTAKEIESVVSKAYYQHRSEHATEFFEDSTKKQDVVDAIMSRDNNEAIEYIQQIEEFKDFNPTQIENFIEDTKQEEKEKKSINRVFWFYDDGKLKIDIKTLIDFINSLGYYLYYPTKTPNDYTFIKIENNIIKLSDERNIKNEVLNFVLEKKQNAVYNLLSDRIKYWSKAFLNSLPVLQPTILKDDKLTSYFYTPDFVYKVTADKIEKIEYLDLKDGYVWESQITQRNFEYTNQDDASYCDFAKFIEKISGENLNNLISIIGYLLHNYKSPAKSKSVVIYDKNLSQITGEPEGGTGKGLIIEGIKKIREVASVPGDRVDFKRSFLFQEISESTQILWIDETPKGFDFKKLFSRITNGFPVEKKNQQPIFIENEKAPKVVITTNFKPKGISGSHKRRRYNFAINPYFNADHTPIMEFKKEFFTEWNDKEWNDFFSLYLEFTQYYLRHGVVEIEDPEDMILTIISEFGADFKEFMIDNGNYESFLKKGEIDVKQAYEYYLNLFNLNRYEIKFKDFFEYIKKIYKLRSVDIKEERRLNKIILKLDHE